MPRLLEAGTSGMGGGQGMNIIDEIRGEADWHDSLASCGHGYDIRSIADRLASMNALVPMPDGEPENIRYLPLGIGFTVSDRVGVFHRIGTGCGGDPIESYVILESVDTKTRTHIPHGTIVQPVRLVPLADVEA